MRTVRIFEKVAEDCKKFVYSGNILGRFTYNTENFLPSSVAKFYTDVVTPSVLEFKHFTSQFFRSLK